MADFSGVTKRFWKEKSGEKIFLWLSWGAESPSGIAVLAPLPHLRFPVYFFSGK